MKVATSACEGYVASIAMLLLTSALHLQLPQILSFGIVGAIPAAVCSWLAGTTKKSRDLAPVATAGDLPPDGAGAPRDRAPRRDGAYQTSRRTLAES
jgi:hypothetical protein